MGAGRSNPPPTACRWELGKHTARLRRPPKPTARRPGRPSSGVAGARHPAFPAELDQQASQPGGVVLAEFGERRARPVQCTAAVLVLLRLDLLTDLAQL